MNTILQGALGNVLSRLSGERDVVFGATRACRRSGVTDADEIVGPLINTVPVRVDVDLEAELGTWLQSIRASSLAVREFEHTPLVKVQSWSEVTRINPLFESIVVYEHSNTRRQCCIVLRSEWQHRKFQFIGQTNYPLALIVYGGMRLLLRLEYSRSRFEDDVARRLMAYVKTLLERIAVANATSRLATLSFLPFEEKSCPYQPWTRWYAQPTPVPLHERFEERGSPASGSDCGCV